MSAAAGLAAAGTLGAFASLCWARPWGLVRPLGAALGWLSGRVLRVRRREVIERVGEAGIAAPEQVADGMYRSLGVGLMELLWSTGPGERRLEARVALTPRAERALAEASATGAVIASGHTGNWDLIASAVAPRASLWVVSKRLSVRALDAAWRRLRRRRGVRVLYPEGAVTGALSLLRSNALVAMMIDQVPVRTAGAARLPFLGRDAWHDQAPAALAARSRKPLLVALGRRLADGTHELDVPLVIASPRRPGPAWVREATLRSSQALEAHVREQPEQWLWLHRRWRDPRS